MRHRIVNTKRLISWLFIPLMATFFTANAANSEPHYSVMLVGGQNPWALPQQNNRQGVFRAPPQYEGPQCLEDQGQVPGQSRGESAHTGQYSNSLYNRNKFITEEFLQSLEHQQSQLQVMPPQKMDTPAVRKESQYRRSVPGVPNPGIYNYPAYGSGYADPYSMPPVVSPWSPWGIGVSDW